MIHIDDINDEVKEWLFDMQDYGYDFRFINLENLKDQEGLKLKRFRRKVYLRYECDYCMENEKPKRWTSILGVFEILFSIQALTEFIDENPEFEDMEENEESISNLDILKWKKKIYR